MPHFMESTIFFWRTSCEAVVDFKADSWYYKKTTIDEVYVIVVSTLPLGLRLKNKSLCGIYGNILMQVINNHFCKLWNAGSLPGLDM